MARVKRGVPAHRRHKGILDRAKGFRLSKKLLFRPANEAVLHALAYAFRDRRRRKREMRALWIARINAASRQSGLPYNKLMHGLRQAGVEIVRHMLAALAVRERRSFVRPVAVLGGVQDAGNVGAICRTAAAAGAPALAILPGSADPYGPKAVRASAGNVFRLKVARARWKDLEGLDGFGAAASSGAPLAEAPIESAGMIVLGSEAHGLSRPDLALVTVPLTEGIESLNVAAAAALILFEIRRRLAA